MQYPVDRPGCSVITLPNLAHQSGLRKLPLVLHASSIFGLISRIYSYMSTNSLQAHGSPKLPQARTLFRSLIKSTVHAFLKLSKVHSTFSNVDNSKPCESYLGHIAHPLLHLSVGSQCT